METLLVLLALCEGNPPVTGGFPSQRASKAKFWFCICCTATYAVVQTVGLPLIWNAVTFMWCNISLSRCKKMLTNPVPNFFVTPPVWYVLWFVSYIINRQLYQNISTWRLSHHFNFLSMSMAQSVCEAIVMIQSVSGDLIQSWGIRILATHLDSNPPPWY